MKTIAQTTLNSLELDDLCVNTIRFLSIDAIQNANSGHPGLPMGAAPMAYTLWTKFLQHNPSNPHWFNRDRFVLSAGHGSMLLYSLLHLTGYDLSLDELKKVSSMGQQSTWSSRTWCNSWCRNYYWSIRSRFCKWCGNGNR